MTSDAYGAMPAATRYPVTVNVAYPEQQSRVIMFFRIILAIPAMFVLYFVGIAAGVVAFIGWFAVVFTGKYPRGMHNFVVGYLRWSTRANAYMLGLTDAYPPFSLEP